MTLLDKITEKSMTPVLRSPVHSIYDIMESRSATVTVSILKSRKNRTSRESIFSSMEKQTAKKFIFRLLLTQAE